MVSDNTGARAAWLEFPQPGEPELVVYDTENAEESAREPLGVDPGSFALLAGVTDRYGYWYSNPESIEDEPYPDQRIDLGSGATEEVSVEAYAADRPGPNSPRTMMVSHAEESEPADYRVIHDATMRQFDVRAGRLVPMGMQPMDARDGGTGRRFDFEAPERYPNAGPGWLVQWLDDDTVVIVQTRGGNDDLLECRHSTGACTRAEQLPEAGGPTRVQLRTLTQTRDMPLLKEQTMPRTTLAATALSLVAALAACTNSDPPQPTEPAATDQQTTARQARRRPPAPQRAR